MSEYESIHGTRVKYLSSDPTLNTTTAGEVWYNSTSGTNKALVNIKAFSAGGNIPTRFYYGSGVGPATTTLGFGGVGPSPQPAHNLTIEYSGFAWAGGGNLNTARRAMYQFGTPTAAVGAGGDYSPASPTVSTATEEYNGSSWTNGNAITEQGSFGAAAGTLTAGLAFGGYNTAQTASSTRTVSYDGTNWTALPTPGSDTNTAGNFTRGGGGTQTAAIFSGGGPSRQLATEAYDGSSWTSLANMNLGRSGQGLLGTQTNALYAGGIQPSPSRTAVTEEWDGSAWATSSASLAAGRNGSIISQAGSTAAATIAGGSTGPAYPETTEEYNSSINAITKATWSSGGAIPTNHRDGFVGSIGTLDAGIAFGGEPLNSEAYLYNGTSWTDSGATMGTNVRLGAGMGTQTAAGSAGGNASVGYSQTGVFQNFNGSSWSEGPDMVTARAGAAGAGTLTAALASSGTSTSNTIVGNTEEYNGSSWSEQNDTGTARIYFSGCGTQTAALIFGGSTTSPSPFTPTANTEEYNGTSWTAGGALLTPLGVHGASGTQTAALGFGGTPTIAGGAGSGYQNVQIYDGTSWSRTASMANAQNAFRGTGGTLTGTYAGGGYNASGNNVGTTEEFVNTIETATASTLTTS